MPEAGVNQEGLSQEKRTFPQQGSRIPETCREKTLPVRLIPTRDVIASRPPMGNLVRDTGNLPRNSTFVPSGLCGNSLQILSPQEALKQAVRSSHFAASSSALVDTRLAPTTLRRIQTQRKAGGNANLAMDHFASECQRTSGAHPSGI